MQHATVPDPERGPNTERRVVTLTTAVTSTGKGKYGTRQYVEAFPLDAEKVNQYIVQMYSVLFGADPASDKFPRIDPGEWVALRVQDVGLPDRDWDDEDTWLWALICTEGVGYTPDAWRVIALHFQSGWVPSTYRVHIHNDKVEEFSDRSVEPVDLADHVRVFGDRLESNFSLWASRAVGK